MTQLQTVAADAWRTQIEAAITQRGERFGGAWVTADRHWRALLVKGADARVISCQAGERVDSIVDLVPAAGWDEREAHDLHALSFDGHDQLRALIEHPTQGERWITPVRGDGVHQVAVGPIHAGVIESGHFRFHVVGERILHLDTRLFYKHRGLEQAAVGSTPQEGLRHAGRACGACAVANSLAYAHAVEDASGLWPSPELRRQRTVLLELERVYNHLNDISAICAGVGYAAGTMAFAAHKDRAQNLNARAFGHRFLFGSVAVGGAARALPAPAAAELRGGLAELRGDVLASWRELEFAGSLHARMDAVGVLPAEAALRLGTVGPAARAAGVAIDARVGERRLEYDALRPAAAPRPDGDVEARFQLRAAELEVSFELLDELLRAPLPASAATRGLRASPVGVGRVESPRGETVCIVELQAGRVGRLHLRSAAYANWPSVAHASAGNLLPDFPLINKSFELCYACCDR